MGSPESEEGRTEDEGPQFEAIVEPMWMGKTEITWAEYKQFMGLYDAFKDFVESLDLEDLESDDGDDDK